MKTLFYRFLTALARRFGLAPVRLLARGVAAGYFFLFPARVAVARRFYQDLFPHRGPLFALYCTWRQYLDFSNRFVDRLRLQGIGSLTYRFEGLERLTEALAAGRGAVLLMSHLGDWEVAARLLKQDLPGLELMLYMGARPGEQIEGMQKDTLDRSGIRIVGVAPRDGAPLEIVKALGFLRGGGFVSMAADLVWHAAQPTVPVLFLGRRIKLPRAPYHLALVSGAPLFVFFALREAPGRFVFQARKIPLAPKDAPAGREAAACRAAQAYADLLAETVRRYPFQWHHFAPLPQDGPDSAAASTPG